MPKQQPGVSTVMAFTNAFLCSLLVGTANKRRNQMVQSIEQAHISTELITLPYYFPASAHHWIQAAVQATIFGLNAVDVH